MARHGVAMREVWVRSGDVVNVWAPVRGRMFAKEGFPRAPAWRRRAILAHDAGNVRLRHVPWALGVVAVAETVLQAAREVLLPMFPRGPQAFALGGAGVMLGEVGVVADLCALTRRQQFAADRWAVQHGGVAEMRVALYLRVSTDDKGRDLDTQRLPPCDFCTAHGWTDVSEHADHASATDLPRRVAAAPP